MNGRGGRSFRWGGGFATLAAVALVVLSSTVGASAVVGQSLPRPTSTAYATTASLAVGATSTAASTTGPVSSPTAAVPSIHLAPLNLPGPHPAAWGPSGTPPGDPFADARSVGSTAPLAGGGPSGSDPCYGAAVAAPLLATYPVTCVAHDEPTLSFYSSAAASGGNVSWNLTLPSDASATANQSDLYAAAWVGLVVADPAAWLGECYIEVQFYPDFEWGAAHGPIPDLWGAAVVGWQIDPNTGAVDTCFYSPLYVNDVPSDGYLSMTGGDNLLLTLLGWPGAAAGENVSVADATSGQSSYVNLFNATAAIPLDPAYATQQFAEALLWTTGGQAPLSFGFEIGRGGNPSVVANNSYGGCNPGPGAPSHLNPSTPCASYDPVSWVNDTLTPWGISVPEFYAGRSTTVPAQFGVSSTVGGASALDALSQGTCLYRIGSAYCQYPWFGYSCTAQSFTFGAVDFAGEANDFGQGAEYPSPALLNAAGLPQFGTASYAIPACGSPAYTLGTDTSGVAGGGIAFLSHLLSGSRTVNGLGAGSYSLTAVPPAGAGFDGWTVTGNAAVASTTSAVTTLVLTGSGTVSADFAASPPQVAVTFASPSSGSSVVVIAGTTSSGGQGTIVPAGGGLLLTPGAYTVQAGPAPGTIFDGWAVTSGAAGALVASPTLPVTVLVVTDATSTVTVRASYSATAATVNVTLVGMGDGTVTLNSVSFPYNNSTGLSGGNVSLALGSYAATAVAAPGWTFLGWNYTPSTYLILLNATTNVSFDGTAATLTALFAANITTLNFASVDGGGQIAFNGVGPLLNGTVTNALRGAYAIDALPFGNNTFLHWNVSNPAALWISKANYPITRIVVNSTGTVSAVFGPAAGVSLTLANSPANGGSISFNYRTYAGASATNDSVATGPYLLTAVPAVDYVFVSWTVTAPNSLASGILTVGGGTGTVTAHFASLGYPVSFVTAANAHVQASLDSQTLSSGGAIGLAAGTYPLAALVGANATFLQWVATGSITVTNRTNVTTSLTVSGPGTLFAVVNAFALGAISSSTPVGEVGRSVTFTAHFSGVSPRSFAWFDLPTGCASRSAATVLCTPTAAGTASVYVTVKGPNGIPLSSSPLEFSVSGALAVQSFGASVGVLDLGMATTLTAVAVGGVGPLTYAYAPLPAGCASANQSVLSCTPTATGTTIIEVAVSDTLGTVQTANLTVSVFPTLALHSVTVNVAAVTVGVPFTVAINATGGSPPLSYRYGGLPTNCGSADTSTLRCVPNAPGSYTINVSATDAVGAAQNGSVGVVVNPAPTIEYFNATPDQVAANATFNLTVVASGGTGPLTYVVTGLPPGCITSNASAFSCTPTTAGTYTLTATVTDSDGVPSAAYPTIVTVVAGPTSGSGGAPPPLSLWIWVAIGLVIAVALILGYLLLRRKPASPPTAPPTSVGGHS